MTPKALFPILITASLALLLVAGFLTNPEPTTAVNPVPCPTLVPAATATPDGVIDLPNDILGVILQFKHNCA